MDTRIGQRVESLMTIRWGQRSTGGIVKAGHGGWSLTLGWPPALGYTNPATGDGATVVGWRLLRARRRIMATRARQAEKRRLVQRYGRWWFAEEWDATSREEDRS